jgi:hypothetical protein
MLECCNGVEADGWMLWNLMKCLMKLMDEWCGTWRKMLLKLINECCGTC